MNHLQPNGMPGGFPVSMITSDALALFAAGYDPSTKETPAGAQSKVDTAIATLGDLAGYDTVLAAMEDETIIVGGVISTSLIDVDDLFAETITVTGSVSSNNYSAGSAGWTIGATSAELNDVTIRGTLDAVDGSFAGDLTGGSMELSGNLDVTGSMEFANGGIIADSGGTLVVGGGLGLALSAINGDVELNAGGSGDVKVADRLLIASNVAYHEGNLSPLETADIGSSVQAYSAALTAIAGLSPGTGVLIFHSASGYEILTLSSDFQIVGGELQLSGV